MSNNEFCLQHSHFNPFNYCINPIIENKVKGISWKFNYVLRWALFLVSQTGVHLAYRSHARAIFVCDFLMPAVCLRELFGRTANDNSLPTYMYRKVYVN